MKQLKIPTRDLEELSAYLDGQLSRRKAAHLGTRLEQDQDLKAAHIELQLTRSLLRASPRIRSPRNYTLTPDMVPKTIGSMFRFRPAYGLMSAVASLLLILVVSVDLLGTSRLNFETASDQAAPSIALVQEKETELEMKAMEAPAGEAEVGISSEGDESIPEEVPPEAYEPDERSIEAEPLLLEEAAPEVAADSLEASPVEEAEQLRSENAAETLMEEPDVEGVSEYATEAPVEDTPVEIMAESTTSGGTAELEHPAEAPEAPEAPPVGAADETIPTETVSEPDVSWSASKPLLAPILWAEIGLALTAVTAGILAWIQRRRF